MKSILSIASILVLAACGQAHDESQVAATRGMRPNMYTCAVEGDMSLGYTTTNMAGKPQFHLTQTSGAASFPVVSVTGNAIAVKGTKVSVRNFIPDHSSTQWTLVIPAGLLIDTHAVKFHTTLTEVVTPSSIVGPLPGQVTTTKVRKADCEANFAAF